MTNLPISLDEAQDPAEGLFAPESKKRSDAVPVSIASVRLLNCAPSLGKVRLQRPQNFIRCARAPYGLVETEIDRTALLRVAAQVPFALSHTPHPITPELSLSPSESIHLGRQ
jgi:hypothetical protein